MSGPNLSPTPPKTERSAPLSTNVRRLVILVTIGGVIIFLLCAAVGIVFVNTQGALIAQLMGNPITPVGTAKNSPVAVASAAAATALPTAATATAGLTAVVAPTASIVPLQITGTVTAPLTGTLTTGAAATGSNPAATAARATSIPKPRATTPAPPPPASPAPQVAPGVYVTNLRIDPSQPMNGQNPTFYVSFLNTYSTPMTYTWFIKVFEPDKRQSFGEESKVGNVMPVGTSTFPSATNWKAPGEQPCRPFIARVFYYMAQENAVVEFSTPEGNAFLIDFKVCQ